jgi:predicted dinucleotide-binding enzyme
MTPTAIIGLGNMGKGLARRLAGKTELVLGSRDLDTARAFAASIGDAAVSAPAEAAAGADIVIVALPYAAALDFVRSTDLSGKVLVDITNPLKADFSGLTIGHTTSAAEELQAAAPGAQVVKAYNTIFASLFDLPVDQTASVPVFLAGNDDAAVKAVEELVVASGFAVEKTGALDAARLVEPLGMLNIRLGFHLGRGGAIAPAWTNLAA